MIQAYLKDSRDDLADLIAWSSARARPVTVRLVKGAYWDTETVAGRGRGLAGAGVRATRTRPTPTTSAAPACSTTTTATVRAAFGSHNLRSLGLRRRLRPVEGHPRRRLRDPAALRDGRAAARRRPPAGPAAAGLRPGGRAGAGHGLPGAPAAGEHVQRELRPPPLRRGPGPRRAAGPARRRRTCPSREPPARRRADRPGAPGAVRARAAGRVAAGRRCGPPFGRGRATRSARPRRSTGPGGDRRASRCTTAATIASVDPARPDDGRGRVGVVRAGRGRRGAGGGPPGVAGVAADAGRASGRRCCSGPRSGCGPGATTWPPSRCSRRASRGRRPTPTSARPSTSASTTGGRCSASTQGGAGAVAAGRAQPPPLPGPGHRRGHRPVELPAGHPHRDGRRRPGHRQRRAVQAGRADAGGRRRSWSRRSRPAGCPPGVLAFLPGVGEEVGAYLVEHPDVVVRRLHRLQGGRAWRIIEAAAVHRPGQRHVKRVVAEMGGKNALVVDADADLDQAVPIVVGVGLRLRRPEVLGRCSRLIVLDAVYDELVERLVGADPAAAGRPSPGDGRRRRARSSTPRPTSGCGRYVELAPAEGRVVLAGDDVPDAGVLRRADGRGRRAARQPPGHARRSSARCWRCCGPPTSTRPSPWPTTPTTP